MLPPAPGRFSTTIGWPSALPISVATSRARVSEVPAEKGTISRIGWFGHAPAVPGWARAAGAAESVSSAAATRARRVVMGILAGSFPCILAGTVLRAPAQGRRCAQDAADGRGPPRAQRAGSYMRYDMSSYIFDPTCALWYVSVRHGHAASLRP